MVWYPHVFQNFPQFIVIHTVKGFGIVNKAERDVFLELSCFFHDPADVGNLISGSLCNAGDPGSIPGSGSSPGEGIGYPLQYSWASLMAQLVKNLPFQCGRHKRLGFDLGQEDPLKEGMATHSNILA